jgi:hypothetical protein
MVKIVKSVTALFVFFLLVYPPNPALAANEPRIALVIGNSDYTGDISPLKNPVNDAKSMSRALEKLGFTVLTRLNAGRADMREGVREFEDKLKRGGVGLFFYAGHGLQVDGENYLVPVDADVKRKYDVDDQCLKASYVLGAMEEAGNRLNIIILDACRNNPFRSFRSAGGGLAKMDAPTGSLLAYATAPGSVAADGAGNNGLYTSQLLKYMDEPNLELLSMFRKVRVAVMKESGKLQVPWESTSLTGEFYFVPGQSDSAPATTGPPPTPPSDTIASTKPTHRTVKLKAIGGVSASASSNLKPWRSVTYVPQNVLDGVAETIWCEGEKKGPGVGESITIRLSQTTQVAGFRIINGYPRLAGAGEDRWEQNSRVRSFEVEFSDGRRMTWELEDIRDWQGIQFEPVTAAWVKFSIREVYYGSKWPNDTCVSELRVMEMD